MAELKDLLGKTVSSTLGFDVGSEWAELFFTDGSHLELYHNQDCCESVEIAEVIGDPADLVGAPLGECEEVSFEPGEVPDGCEPGYESFTWTFYKFGTHKGYVTLRWLGESNGFYSEVVNVRVVTPRDSG